MVSLPNCFPFCRVYCSCNCFDALVLVPKSENHHRMVGPDRIEQCLTGVLFVAYGLSLMIVAVAIFFTIARGIEFGDSKIKKWFTSILISLFSSIFCTQPIKVGYDYTKSNSAYIISHLDCLFGYILGTFFIRKTNVDTEPGGHFPKRHRRLGERRRLLSFQRGLLVSGLKRM